MLRTVLILTALAFSGVESTCLCYTYGTYKGANAQLANGFDNTTFQACYPGNVCPFVACSPDVSTGWQSVSITWGGIVVDPAAAIQIFDGPSDSATPIATLKPDTNYTVAAPFKIATSTSCIYVKYTQTVTTASNIFYGNIKSGGALIIPTSAPITTPAPTTPLFNSSFFTRDPLLISHDLLVVFNQKSSSGSGGLSAITSLASQFVGLLSISNNVNSTSDSQTRLGLASFTPYDPYYSFQGQIWGMSASDFNDALPRAGIVVDGNVNSALVSLINTAFKVSGTISPTRPNVQRTVLVFAADWPSANADLGTDVKNAFAALGVNLVIVGYKISDTTTLTSNPWYNFVNVLGSGLDNVAEFVNPFFLNLPKSSGGPVNQWCPRGIDINSGSFQEPTDYNGPKTSNANWNETVYTGQQGRYCNFLNREYIYNNTASAWLTVTVFYELEVEKDYLKFYADGVEIESFTGNDVSSASFATNATVLRATFTTDSKAVYRGFYATIK